MSQTYLPKNFDPHMLKMLRATEIANEFLDELRNKFPYQIPMHCRYDSTYQTFKFIVYISHDENDRVLYMPFFYRTIQVFINKEMYK